MKYNIKN
ncbi:hypothetical protein SCARD494_09479 [Seiridium cardinale]